MFLRKAVSQNFHDIEILETRALLCLYSVLKVALNDSCYLKDWNALSLMKRFFFFQSKRGTYFF